MALNKMNAEKLDAAILLVDKACVAGLRCMDGVPDKVEGDDLYVILTFLERFVFHLEGIVTLLKPYKRNGRMDASIGILIRVCLLDFMTLTYLTSYAFDDEQALTVGKLYGAYLKQIEILLCDHIYNTLKYLKIGKEAGVIPPKDYVQAVTATFENYSRYFTDDKVDLVAPEMKVRHTKFPSPQAIFQRISSHPAVKRFARIYDLYCYYSKYEHLGILSPVLQRVDASEQLNSILAGVEYSLKGLTLAAAMTTTINPSLSLYREQLDAIVVAFEAITAV
jgi:hypothetical protein